jgi:hypothetical protein
LEAAQAKEPLLDCAFYSVADSHFFVGLVALINSLRLTGHEQPIFVVDSGLTPEQRDILAGRVTLIPAPEDEAAIFLAPLGPFTHPAKVAIVLDADIIVTRSLAELIAIARSGRIVGFRESEPSEDRFFTEWRQVLDLPRLVPRPYLNAGQLLIPHTLSRRLIPHWSEGQARLDLGTTRYGSGRMRDPFYFADQDVLNATIGGILEPDEVVLLEHRLAPHSPFPGLGLIDERRLVCRYADGVEPFLVHHVLAKPWLKATRTTIYSSLLTRLLLEPDVVVRLEPGRLPVRLRRGTFAAVDRRRADLQALTYSAARKQLGRFGIRTRLADRRARRQSRDADPRGNDAAAV